MSRYPDTIEGVIRAGHPREGGGTWPIPRGGSVWNGSHTFQARLYDFERFDRWDHRDEVLALAEDALSGTRRADSRVTNNMHHMVHPRQFRPDEIHGSPEISVPICTEEIEGQRARGANRICASCRHEQIGNPDEYVALQSDTGRPVEWLWMPRWAVQRHRREGSSRDTNGTADNPPIYIDRALVS